MLLHSFNRLIPFFYVHSSFLISIRHLTSRSSSHHLLLSLSFIRSCATLRVRARLYGVRARLCAVRARLCAVMSDVTRIVRDIGGWGATFLGRSANLRVGAGLCALMRDLTRGCGEVQGSVAAVRAG